MLFRRFFLLSLSLLLIHPKAQAQSPYVNYEPTFSGNVPDVDHNKPVGTLDGGVSVNLTGAATYEIPIKVAPGTAGVQPKLSLVYNSQAGTGILGKGWALSGLSTITRGGRDYYHDGQAAPIEWNDKDPFFLDGMRLHPITGGNGQAGTVYAPEQENWTRVEQQGLTANGPDWFLATLKDGTTVRYGESRNSKVVSWQGNQAALAWKVSSSIDVSGNEIQYEYENVDYQNRLSKIYYTVNLNAGIKATNEIRFNYRADRFDLKRFYVSGERFEDRGLLESIEVYNYEEGMVRRYEMNYTSDGNNPLSPSAGYVSLLQRVTEVGATGVDLNSTVFEYNSNTNRTTLTNTELDGVPRTDDLDAPIYGVRDNIDDFLLTIDFNKDGYTDLLAISKEVQLSTGCFNPSIGSIFLYKFYLSFYLNNKNNGFDKKYDIDILEICDGGMADGESYKKTMRKENFQIGDFDGDGTDDLAIFSRNTGVNTDYNTITGLDFYTNLSNIASNGHPNKISVSVPTNRNRVIDQLHNSVGNNNYHEWNKAYAYTADFDGDGVSEILTTTIGQWAFDFHLNITSLKYNKVFEPVLNTPGSSLSSYSIARQFMESSFCAPVNINGGTAQEILSVKRGDDWSRVVSIKRPVGSTSNTSRFYANVDATMGYPNYWHGINLGDFNGDGLTDVITKTRNNNQTWEIGYSDGTRILHPEPFSFGPKPINNSLAGGGTWPYYLCPPDYTPTSQETPIITADFNGDGKSDIAHFYGEAWSYTNPRKVILGIMYSKGYGFEREDKEIEWDYHYFKNSTYDISGRPQYLYNNTTLYMGDFNGDGKPDIMNRYGMGTDLSIPVYLAQFRKPNYLSIGAGAPNNLLTNVRNGMGLREIISYMPINKARYEETHISQYPFIALNGPFYVVSSQQLHHKSGDVIRTNYFYKNLFALKDGRGLLGFGEIKKQTPFDRTNKMATTVQTFAGHQSPLFLPTLTQIDKFVDDYTVNQQISSDVSYSDIDLIGTRGRYKIRPQLKQETNLLSNTTKTTTYQTYDIWDNPTAIHEEIPGIEFSDRTITYASPLTTASIYGYAPQRVTTTISKNGTQTVTSSSYTTYANGKAVKSVQFYGTPAQITTTYNYNLAGTVDDKTVTAPNETPRITKYGYDPEYRFVTSEINPLSQTTSSTYDPKFGTVRTATGFNGQTTQYEYDEFGKLKKTTLPDGRDITEHWEWLSGTQLTDGIMRKVVSDTATTTSYTDYNLLGKEVAHGTKIWTGQDEWSEDKLHYSVEGLLLKKEFPRRNSQETALVQENKYDKYGRLEQVSTQHGATDITYNYQGSNLLTTTTDPAGRVKRTLKDPADKLLESEDESGKMKFEYDAWGNVVKNKAGFALISSATYDAYNRKSSITETSSGTTRYEYNGWGALKKQTDAAGKVTTFDYDLLGRPTKTSSSEGTVVTEYYNTAGTGNANQLKSITRTNAQGRIEHSKTYEYDYLSRLEKTTYNNGRYTQWKYDRLSRVQSQKFVSGVVAQFRYQDGHIQEITDGAGTLHYRLEDVNGLGMPTQEWRGNSKTTLQNYDYGNLTLTTTPNVQHYGLNHDFQRGLITRRTDGLVGLYDDFTYDRAGRLTQTTIGYLLRIPLFPAPDQIQTYGTHGLTAGNILTKSDIGTYSYGKYHQLTYTDNAANSIPTATQNVTYSSYHRPLTIEEGDFRAEFTYDGEADRALMKMYKGGVLDYRKEYYDDGTTVYIDSRGIITQEITPVAANDGVKWIAVNTLDRNIITSNMAVVMPEGMAEAIVATEKANRFEEDPGKEDDWETLIPQPCCMATEVYYPYADHLGSIVALTDGAGNVVHRQAFDPWGRRRDVRRWLINDGAVPPPQFRWLWGYTGHEPLDEFGLVNMNARLYDPKLGRMLSVDNYVSDPTSPLAYNRYTYALNNPISYVDPDGNEPILTGILVGALISATMYTGQAAFAPGGLQRNFNFDGFMASTLTGAVMGGLTAGVGQAFGGTAKVLADGSNFTAVFTKEAGRAAAHGLLSGGFTAANGGDFWTGFASGALSSFASHALLMGGVELSKVGGAFFNAGVGGLASYAQGGDPWVGAAASLMSYTLNQLLTQGEVGGGDGKGNGGPTVEAAESLNGSVTNAILEHAGLKIYNTKSYTYLPLNKRIYFTKAIPKNSGMYPGLKSASRLGLGIKWFGRGIGVMGIVDQFNKYQTGDIGAGQAAIEIGVGGYSTFGPYGWAVGIGWEAGRYITTIPWYRQNVRPYIQDALGVKRD